MAERIRAQMTRKGRGGLVYPQAGGLILFLDRAKQLIAVSSGIQSRGIKQQTREDVDRQCVACIFWKKHSRRNANFKCLGDKGNV